MMLGPLSPSTTVAEVLAPYPTAAGLFVARRTACVGCYMTRFCTLRDVAAIYGWELEDLIAELGDAIAGTYSTLGGSNA